MIENIEFNKVYSHVHNISELYNVLVHVQFVTSKMELDI